METVSVNGNSADNVYLYVKKGVTGKPVGINEQTYSKGDNTDNYKEAKIMKEAIEGSGVQYADIYITIPCLEKKETAEKDVFCSTSQSFLDAFQETIQIEFNWSIMSSFRRSFMGNIEIESGGVRQICRSFINRNRDTGLAVVTMTVPACVLPVEKVVDSVVRAQTCDDDLDGGLYVRSYSHERKWKRINQWLKNSGLHISGKPKVCIFSQATIDLEKRIQLLVCEQELIGKVKDPYFKQLASNDIAQYDSAEIYASETCLIEIAKTFEHDYLKRMNNHIFTLFVVELIVFQDASVTTLNNSVDAEIDRQRKNPAINGSIAIIEKLLNETAGSLQFWDVRKFKYPTAEQLAINIADAFRIQKMHDTYERNKDKLEQLINVKTLKLSEKDNKMTSNLLLLLALIQVIPTLYLVFTAFITGGYDVMKIYSGLASTITVFVVWIIYRRWSKRYTKL